MFLKSQEVGHPCISLDISSKPNYLLYEETEATQLSFCYGIQPFQQNKSWEYCMEKEKGDAIPAQDEQSIMGERHINTADDKLSKPNPQIMEEIQHFSTWLLSILLEFQLHSR